MVSEKEKMLSGAYYFANDPLLIKERKEARDLLHEFNHSRPKEKKKRQEIIKSLLRPKGNFYIEPPFYCDYGYNIGLGNNFYANFNCIILDVNPVIIGENVLFGPNVQIYTGTHPIKPKERIAGKEFGKQIVIEDNVWLGGGVIVCPGVKIGKGSVIGAGSIVTRDIPENVVAVGNPCRVIKKIKSRER